MGPAVAIGVDAEVVEQLAPGFAREPFLADRTPVHGHQPLRAAPAARGARPILDEVDVEGLVPFRRRAVVDEVHARRSGGKPGEDRLRRAAANRPRARPALSVVAGLGRPDAVIVRPRVPDPARRVHGDIREVVVEIRIRRGNAARDRSE